MRPDVCLVDAAGVPSRPCQLVFGAVALQVVRGPGAWSPKSGGRTLVRVPWAEVTAVRVEDALHRPFGRPAQKLTIESSRKVLELLVAPAVVEEVMPQIRWHTASGAHRKRSRSARTFARHERVLPGGRTRWPEAAMVATLALWSRVVRWTGLVLIAALNVAILFGSGVLLLSANSGVGATGTAFGIGTNGVYTSSVSHLIDSEAAADTTPLPAATEAPTPLPTNTESPLPSHQVFGFAPYWTLNQSASFDVAGLTTLAYFSVDVNPDGSLDQGGPGWNGLQSQALVDLESRAHQAGDRVVLTITDLDQGSLDELTATPSAPATLATALIPLLRAKGLDGVNLDFEGTGPQDQNGLTNLVTQVSSALRAADPQWQVTMDTYASSASSNAGFYNIGALAPAVDAFFVMSYSLNLDAPQTSASPLTSQMFSDLTAIREYLGVVPASKVILGLPYFGYDWPTTGPQLGAAADGPASTVTAAEVESSGLPLYWDAATDTAWTSYQVGSQWHQSYFENANSLYLAAQLASNNNLAGDGIWALGMDGNDPTMLGALDGEAPPIKSLPAGPAPTTTTSSAANGAGAPPTTGGETTTTATLPNPLSVASGGNAASSGTDGSPSNAPSTTTTSVPDYWYLGDFNGMQVRLTLVVPPGLPDTEDPQPAGQLTGFSTNDPGYQCLESSPGLTVDTYANHPGLDVIVATMPSDCSAAEFFFPASVVVSG